MLRGMRQMALGDTGRGRTEPAKPVSLQSCCGLEFSRYCHCVQQGAAGGAGLNWELIHLHLPKCSVCVSLLSVCLVLD